MKGYFVDTFGAVAFFTTVAGFSELVIAGMHPAQVLIATHAEVPRLVGVFA